MVGEGDETMKAVTLAAKKWGQRRIGYESTCPVRLLLRIKISWRGDSLA